MLIRTQKTLFALLFSTTLMSACGGGGGTSSGGGFGSSPVKSTLAFPLQPSYQAFVSQGSSTAFTVSGTCSGTASYSESKPLAATFEASAALATTFSVTLNLSNCTVASAVTTQTAYYDANYTSIGSLLSSTTLNEYTVSTAPQILPATVHVDDKGTIGTFNVYTDSSKATATGTRVLTYVVEADTANTALVNMTAKSYNTSNQLTSTSQTRYRMSVTSAGVGTLVQSTVDIQNGTTHLLLTPN